MSPRVLCSQQCCLPADHGPAFHHCCRDHLRYGGRLSQDEMDSWYAFSWGHGVYKKARRLVAATYRLMSKWRIVQLTVLGSMVALWIAVQTGPAASRPNERPHVHPQLTLPYTHGYDNPGGVFGMMNTKGRQIELDEGYHKRAYVYVGELAVLTTFDTGSFRNAI